MIDQVKWIKIEAMIHLASPQPGWQCCLFEYEKWGQPVVKIVITTSSVTVGWPSRSKMKWTGFANLKWSTWPALLFSGWTDGHHVWNSLIRPGSGGSIMCSNDNRVEIEIFSEIEKCFDLTEKPIRIQFHISNERKKNPSTTDSLTLCFQSQGNVKKLWRTKLITGAKRYLHFSEKQFVQ